MPIHRCECCGKQYKAHRSKQRSCSRACAVKIRSGASRKSNGVELRCRKCGRLYRVNKYTARNSTYCSRKCKDTHQAITNSGSDNPNFKNIPPMKCEGCGKQFFTYDKRRRFCSTKCSQKLSRNEYLANVRRGLDAELMCCKDLKAKGYTAFLSAGSRGPFDVIAFNAEHMLLVQVKRTRRKIINIPAKHIKALRAVVLPVATCLKRQVWVFIDGEGWKIQEVTK